MLTTAGTYSEDQLFATLDPLTKKWQLPQGMEVTLTDTVVFIQDLPTQLIEAFQSTLEESRTMDLLLHVVDASAPDRLQHERTVQTLIKELALENIPCLTVYNKRDQVDSKEFVPTLFPNVLISTKISEDKERLVQAIRAQMMELLEPYQLEISPTDGQILSELRRMTLMISEEYAENENRYIVKGFAKKESKWLAESEKE